MQKLLGHKNQSSGACQKNNIWQCHNRFEFQFRQQEDEYNRELRRIRRAKEGGLEMTMKCHFNIFAVSALSKCGNKMKLKI